MDPQFIDGILISVESAAREFLALLHEPSEKLVEAHRCDT